LSCSPGGRWRRKERKTPKERKRNFSALKKYLEVLRKISNHEDKRIKMTLER
jgi:hypothetical protein